MYVHHQIIEGLSVTAGQFLPQLEEYEAKKMNEVYYYFRGIRNYPPKLRNLRVRIERFTENLWNRETTQPFKWGKEGDYYAQMPEAKLADHYISVFKEQRQEKIEKVLEAKKVPLFEKVHEMIREECEVEKDFTKRYVNEQFITRAVGGGFGGGGGVPNFRQMKTRQMSGPKVQSRGRGSRGPTGSKDSNSDPRSGQVTKRESTHRTGQFGRNSQRDSQMNRSTTRGYNAMSSQDR